MAEIPFQNTYVQLSDSFFKKAEPAQVPAPTLVQVNDDLAEELGIDPQWLRSADGVEVMAGNSLAVGSEPIAQAYAGHQFGGFNPQLGDGRAILLGEIIDRNGVRRDLQLKGSGRTPYSRGGDGKSALGPAVREYILSEAMTALGVPSTRALGLVSTGESVLRQEGAVSGGVFTRVAASHIRIGTFQYFAAQRDMDAVKELADYTISRHYPECLCTADPQATYLEFFKTVIRKQADLIAQWMSLGFIHGVMNTDNCAISGETLDYGPCAFIDVFHPQAVFSSIDVKGRYAWGKQPQIGIWNLSRLAECIQPLFHDDEAVAHGLAETALNTFPDRLREQYTLRFRAKFGLKDSAPDTLVQDGLSMLAKQRVDFTLFFRILTQRVAGKGDSVVSNLFSDKVAFDDWFSLWKKEFCSEKLMEMQAANPVYIPRNHRVEEAIQAAYRGDYSTFHQLNEVLSQPFTEREDYSDYELAPQSHEVVRETFCGT